MALKYMIALLNLDAKAVKDDGDFEGWGSTFGNIDLGRDVVEKGAYEGTIKDHEKQGTMPAMLFSHKWDEPVGEWRGWEEMSKGLKMGGGIWIGDGIPKANQSYKMLKSNSPKGLSIGYSVGEKGAVWDDKAKVRRLIKLDVHEVSAVQFPMNTKCAITAIKTANKLSYDFDFAFKDEEGKIRSVREIESILRDGAGLSATEAKKFISGGYELMNQRDADETDELLASIKALGARISA